MKTPAVTPLPAGSPKRTYSSPLRAAQAEDTRERILAALERLLGARPEADAPFDAVAAEAGVERRTVFRHFETREALFDAFWTWFNARHGLATAPQNVADLVGGPRAAFPAFDRLEGVIRASLHTVSGRAMRARAASARRASFAAALAPVTDGMAAEDAARITALCHLLYSAPAWEVMRDFGGLSGAQAGEAAAWALRLLLSAAARGDAAADASQSPERTPR